MLATAYVISFLAMIVLPILLWVYFKRTFALPWKLVLAGGLTFIASQVLHIPLVFALRPFLAGITLLTNAIILGLLAGAFEETARYILFRFFLKNSRSWKEGLFVGLGHGGTEAVILGIFAGLAFINMMIYRNTDLSTVPSIPADQLDLARQQVAAYWSAPTYMALLGFIERIFAICFHVSASMMVLYSITNKKPVWFWQAVLWHAALDATAVYIGQQFGIISSEAIVAVFAAVSVWIVLVMRRKFLALDPLTLESAAVLPAVQ